MAIITKTSTENTRSRQNQTNRDLKNNNRSVALVFTLIVFSFLSILFIVNFNTLKQIFLTENPIFNLKNYTVTCEGELTYSEHVRQLTDAYLSKQQNKGVSTKNLFLIDFVRLRQLIENSLSTVERCEIDIVYPNQLKIKVYDRVPYAALKVNQTTYLLNRDAVLMKPATEKQLPVPTISFGTKKVAANLALGKEVNDESIRNALKIIHMINTATTCGKYFDLKEIKVDHKELIILILNPSTYIADNCAVKISADNIEVGMAFAAAVFMKNEEQRRVLIEVDASTSDKDSLNAYATPYVKPPEPTPALGTETTATSTTNTSTPAPKPPTE